MLKVGEYIALRLDGQWRELRIASIQPFHTPEFSSTIIEVEPNPHILKFNLEYFLEKDLIKSLSFD